MDKYNPKYHHRRSIRFKGYDYSQAGLYFITICVKNREYLFGEITNSKMILNDAGRMVKNEWLALPIRFQNIQLHEFIVMPNHFHAILEIIPDPVGATLVVAQNDVVIQNNGDGIKKGQPQRIAPTGTAMNKKTLGDIVGAFESIATIEYIRGVKTKNWQPFDGKLWQRNYWEHIIRNENEYNRIAQYIINNPPKWEYDKLNCENGNVVMETQAEYNSKIWMI